MKNIIIIVLTFMFYNEINSQSMELYNKFKTPEGDINYIAPYLFLEKDTTQNNFVKQMKYTYSSYIHKQILRPLFIKRKIDSNIKFKYAKKRILKYAKSKRIIMFNEAHHNPMNRLYLETFLPDLKEHGFSILALETLSWKDTELNERKFPIGMTGAYVVEPYFANFIRKALDLGFKVLPYETKKHDESIESREEAQANNLKKIIDEEKGKIFILAGYSHIAEMPIASHSGDSIKWMAAVLKDKLNIDPLTVDQTEVVESNVLNKVSIPYAKNKPYQFPDFGNRYDLHIVYPKNVEYLHYELGKKKIRILIDEKFQIRNQLVQFYIKSEYEEYKNKAIPYEQLLIESSQSYVFLNSKRTYELIVRDKDYNIVFQKEISNTNSTIYIK